MDLNQLSNDINQNDKAKEVSNADMLAALILIQSRISKIENNITENHKIQLKKYEEISNILATQDKNISAIPVLTANIIAEKTDKITPQISNANETFSSAIGALNQSNSLFKTFLQLWIASMALFFVFIIIFLIWR